MFEYYYSVYFSLFLCALYASKKKSNVEICVVVNRVKYHTALVTVKFNIKLLTVLNALVLAIASLSRSPKQFVYNIT